MGRHRDPDPGAHRLKADDARARAAKVLARVWEDGAFSAAALDAELGRAPLLATRDAALTTELVYGVLRTQGFLEAKIAELARRGRAFDEPTAKAHLLMGLYALCFLERVPAFAAVSEAVSGVAARIGDKPAGFANGVLRAAQKGIEQSGRPSLEDALVEGAPGWLRGALRRSLGRKGAVEFLAAGAKPMPLGIAVKSPADRAAWIARLSESAPEGATFREGVLSPHAILAEHAGDPRRLVGWEQDWIVQEEGAQIVGLALGASAGDRVLDACAGRGNKTWLLHQLVGAEGSVVAADKYPAKLAQLAARIGVETAAVDLTVGQGDLQGPFDRVLVDAPCTGTGTLRRRPEIALQKDMTSVAELAEEQFAIVRGAAKLAKKGGRLVYAVCSVLAEECERVVERLVAEQDDVRLEPAPFDVKGLPCDEGATSFRLLPHVHGTDGFFAASFVVR
ncbi:MAG: Sun protein [Polyangiaceae bacterium]|nr:Sun protein [Polyangiaceae bacterium]